MEAEIPLPPVIKTKRLKLRPLTEADAPSILKYASNPNVARYVTWKAHRNLEDSMVLVRHAHSYYKKGIPEPYGITLNGNDEVVGTVGWFPVSEKNKVVEIAYALEEKLWGQGYIVEACEALIEKIFKDNTAYRIQARCLPENRASARVMEKLGMQYEGTQRGVMFIKNRHIDLKVYAILKPEWKQK